MSLVPDRRRRLMAVERRVAITRRALAVRTVESKPAEMLWLTLTYQMSFFSVVWDSRQVLSSEVRRTFVCHDQLVRPGPTGGSRLKGDSRSRLPTSMCRCLKSTARPAAGSDVSAEGCGHLDDLYSRARTSSIPRTPVRDHDASHCAGGDPTGRSRWSAR